jgi:tetratricopeptide (TPR) repeat protein
LREVVVQVISGPFGVSEGRYDRDKLAQAWEEIIATLRAINAPNAQLSPSPEACRYCPAINICPAVRQLVPRMAEVEALPEGARGAELLDQVEVLQKRLDSIREYYAAQLSADPAFDLPGYAMAPGIVRREVGDWETARARLGEYLEIDDIQGAANYRLGDLEKALGKKLRLKGPELKERFGQILNGLITEKQNGASLKRVKGNPKIEMLSNT